MIAAALRDIAYATRFLRRNPKIAALLILTFGITVAAATTVLSVIDVVLLRDLPYRDPHSLVRVAKLFPQGTPERTHYAELLDWRARNATFDALVGVRWEDANLLQGSSPQQIKIQFVTANLFSMLGVPPLLGRSFAPADERPGADVVILTEGTWRNVFGADPNILGKSIRVNDFWGTADYQVIGVMPSYAQIFELPRAALFLPQPYPLPPGALDPGPVYTVFGRLRTGVPLNAAKDDLSRVIRSAASRFSSPGAYVVSMHEAELGASEHELMMLAAAVALVTLIACINIAGLVLALGATRRQEFTVRAAIGASRRQLALQLFMEHCLIMVIGTLLAASLAVIGVRVVLALAPANLPRLEQLRVDWRLLALGCGLATLISLLSGFLPWLLLSRIEFTATKYSWSTTGLTRWRDGLVALQLGLVLATAMAAALALHSFWLLERINLGYDPSHVVAAQVLLGARWHSAAQTVNFQRQLLARTHESAGFESAALADMLPPSARVGAVYLSDGRLVRPRLHSVTPNYFRVLRIPVLRGEPLSERGDMWPIVVTQSFATQFLGTSGIRQSLGSDAQTVVGVVGDTWQSEQPSTAPEPTVYDDLLDGRDESDRFWLLVRSSSPETVVVEEIRNIVSSIDPNVSLRFTTLDAEIGRTRIVPRFFAVLLGAFGGFGLLLAAIGVFTTVQQSVTERMRELAIRLALGSEPRAICYLVARRLALLSLLAVVAGGWIGLVCAKGLRSVLFGLTPTDGPTLAAAAAILVLVAVTAAWGPIRRAASVDPIVLLRDN